MSARPIDEPHRASSQLELLFDLTFVVAVASVTAQLAHGIAGGHAVDAILPFLQVFFAIWWAWMNFTWFASSYDTDDVPYRLMTLVQMAGVLVLAAGVPSADAGDFRTVTIGYLIMRVGLVALWMRAAREDPASRATGHRYAAGISLVQVGWIFRWVLDDAGVVSSAWMRVLFLALVVAELAVPPVAERPRSTAWHPHHIAERYGLFTIILLGEGVLSASTGFDAIITEGRLDAAGVVTAIASLLLVFALWWLYFLAPSGDGLERHRDRSYRWGYGHYGIFAALAALGAGLEVAVQQAGNGASPSALVITYAVAIPVATFLAVQWAVNAQLESARATKPAVPLTAAAGILVLPWAAALVGPAVVIAGIAAVCWALIVAALLRPS